MGIFGTRERSPVSGKTVRPGDAGFWLERGYVLESLVTRGTFVTDVCETPDGALYLLEAGFTHPYHFGEARLLRALPGGGVETIVEDLNGPAIGLVWHDGGFLVTHRGTLSRIAPDGERKDVVGALPSAGDHHTGHLVISGGTVYFGQGSATNAGIVGPDNLIPHGWLRDHPDFCDIPAFDVTLTGLDYEALDPFEHGRITRTGAFLPFGSRSHEGYQIWGSDRPTGAIYRCLPDGSGLAVHASGLRDPCCLAVSPVGRLLCLDRGSEDRGTRPLPCPDTLWDIRPAAWYGFPDFFAGRSAREVAEERGLPGEHGFLLAEHPPVPAPYSTLPEGLRGAVQMEFCPSPAFGFGGQLFIAQMGEAPASAGIVRFDPGSGEFHDFYRRVDAHGDALERPSAVRFSADGRELYVADHGRPGHAKSGGVWRIRPE